MKINRMSKILDYSTCLFVKPETNVNEIRQEIEPLPCQRSIQYCMQFPRFVQPLIYHFYFSIQYRLNKFFKYFTVKIQKFLKKKKRKKLEKDTSNYMNKIFIFFQILYLYDIQSMNTMWKRYLYYGRISISIRDT